MRIPEGTGGSLAKRVDIISFGGLNKTNSYTDGELEDCDRVTGREYPYLATDDFSERTVNGTTTVFGSAYYNGQLVEVKANGQLYVGGFVRPVSTPEGETKTSIFYDQTLENQPVNLVVIGNWMFYNDAYALDLDTRTLRWIHGSYQFDIVFVSSTVWDTYRAINGIAQPGIRTWGSLSADTVNGMYLSRSDKKTLYEFLSYAEIETRGTDFSCLFRAGQTVTLSASGLPEQSKTVQSSGRGFITFDTEIDYPADLWSNSGYNMDNSPFSNPVAAFNNVLNQFSRIPFSVYIQSGNRLWGCSDEENTIYASPLGSFFNMQQYEGVSTDAYAVAVTSGGEFTGGCALSDGVIFFKKDRIYKIAGDYPEEYTLYEHICAGVRPGAEKSVVVIENVVYYLGEAGVYAYYGGDSPRMLSGKLGPGGPFPADATNLVAGRAGQCYCIAGTKGGETWMYSYDLGRQTWHRQRMDGPVQSMRTEGEQLYVYAQINESPYVSILRVFGRNKRYAEPTDWRQGRGTSWFAELKPFREDPVLKKRPGRLSLRLAVRKDSWARVLLKKDGGRWEEMAMIPALAGSIDYDWEDEERMVDVRITPGRCDVYRLRLEGEGMCRVLSLSRETRIGGRR